MERFARVVPERERYRDTFHDHVLILTLAGETEFSASRIDRLPLEERADAQDAVSFTPAGRERTTLLSRGSLDQVRINIPAWFISQAFDIDAEPSWEAPYNTNDRRSAATVRALIRAQADGPIARVYHDALMIMLARRIGHRFGRVEARKNDSWLPPAALSDVVARIDEDVLGVPSLAELARVAGLSASAFLRAFHGSVGQTPGSYVISRRIARAARILKSTDLPVSAVAEVTGFTSAKRFSAIFDHLQGSPPSQYRQA
jgi:AraC family transcriptional regulator